MPIDLEQDFEHETIAILRHYSGRRTIELDQMLGRDIGIYGSDGVQIADEIEETFEVDLDPLIEAHKIFRPPTWWDRLMGRKHGPPSSDMTVRTLVDYIASECRRRSTSPPPEMR